MCAIFQYSQQAAGHPCLDMASINATMSWYNVVPLGFTKLFFRRAWIRSGSWWAQLSFASAAQISTLCFQLSFPFFCTAKCSAIPKCWVQSVRHRHNVFPVPQQYTFKNRNIVVNFSPQNDDPCHTASQLMETSSNVQGRSAYEQQIWKFQNYYSTLLFQPQRHASCSNTSIIVILTPSWNAVNIFDFQSSS